MTVLIKRYANRKLDNTETSRYITLKGISELVREGKDICVIDNETGEEITPIILSQILVDDQKQHRDRTGHVPGTVLTELIQRGSDALYTILRRSVDDVSDNLHEMRDNVRHWIQPPSGSERVDRSELVRAVHEAVDRALQVADLPTRGEIEALNKNLERLVNLLESFDTRGISRPEERPGS